MKTHFHDILIVDTAGRLAIDQTMMDEIKAVHAAVAPIETLFTVDAMQGQDAVNVARAFNDALPFTGVETHQASMAIQRGGGGSFGRHITGKPIKFAGVSEKMDGLEVFHPGANGIAHSGHGRRVVVDRGCAAQRRSGRGRKLAEKFKKGKDFDFDDFKMQQLQQMRKMGGHRH